MDACQIIHEVEHAKGVTVLATLFKQIGKIIAAQPIKRLTLLANHVNMKYNQIAAQFRARNLRRLFLEKDSYGTGPMRIFGNECAFRV